MKIGKLDTSILPKFHGPTSIHRITKRLMSGDSFKREKALDELGEIGEDHPELSGEFINLIIDSFQDPVPEVRSSAIIAIGMIGKEHHTFIKEAIDPLIHRIRDKDVEVRQNAIVIIEMIAQKTPEIIKNASPYLVARLNDSDKDVREATINCLNIVGNIKPKIITPLLIKKLRHKDPNVRISSGSIINNITKNNVNDVKIAIPKLFESLKDSNQKFRRKANEALITIGIQKPELVMPLFIKCLEDKDREVLWWITALASIKAIGKIAEKRQKATIKAVPLLSKCLIKDIWELRENASITLGKIGKNNLDYVIDAIPNLVKCLKDPDDLVRTTTAHAFDKIGVLPEEYRLIEKSSESLNTSHFAISSIKNFGIDVNRAEKLFIQAKKAFKDHKYEEAIELGAAADEEARRQEGLFKTITENLETTISFIEEVESYGIVVNESKNILVNARKAIDVQNYDDALAYINNAKDLAQKNKNKAKPEIIINVVAYDNFKVGEWSRVTTTLENNGSTFANNLEVDFFGPFESQGSRRIPVIKIGEVVELVLDLSPKIEGRIPLEINISYQDFAKRGYQLSDKSFIKTIGTDEEIKSEKIILFNITTHSSKKDNAPESNIEKDTSKEIECPKCNAKMPENFRICGKCGSVLSKTCSICGHKVPVNFTFCGGCGAKMGNNCPKCNNENPDSYMFCGSCGANLK